MKLIKASSEIWEQEPGLNGVYKVIERAGRVCYKSEDKITEDSAKSFVNRMVDSQHLAMLEHGTVYLKVPYEEAFSTLLNSSWVVDNYGGNPYSEVVLHGPHFCITTNYRVLVEKGWLDDLKYLCEPTEFHKKRVTVHFACDRGVSHEFVRHRVFSFAQESTRYCNYSKDKFGNEITFIEPCWNYNSPERDGWNEFKKSLVDAEQHYLFLIENGWKPQEARAILPNALKTELVMTGFVSDWQHFFDLRTLGTTGAPHPQAKELSEPLMKEFIARKYINN